MYFGCAFTKATFSRLQVRVQCAQLPPRLPVLQDRLRRLRRPPLHHHKVQVVQILVFSCLLPKTPTSVGPSGSALWVCRRKDRWHCICDLPTLYKKKKFCKLLLHCKVCSCAVLLLPPDWTRSHLLLPVQLSRYKRGFLSPKISQFYRYKLYFIFVTKTSQHADSGLRGCPPRRLLCSPHENYRQGHAALWICPASQG